MANTHSIVEKMRISEQPQKIEWK